MKKTKIIATLGPATDSEEMITKLIEEGVNVFRLNFSHGDHAEHGARIEKIKKIREELGLNIGILADLQGPKIRVGVVDVDLVADEEVVLSCDEAKGAEIPVQYKNLYKDVKVNDELLLDDGLLELKVTGINGKKIKAKVIVGGHLSSKKGINLITGSISAEVITEKDRQDAKFALENEVDFIALSFVKSAKDIEDLRKIIKENSKSKHKS
jgi:pyruvate kinase